MTRFIPCALAFACAQLVAAEQRPMEHVLVTVPLHKKTAETALPFTAISGDELRRSAAASIGETLQGRPGLSNASFGPGVGQPAIRGQQGPRVLVLQNGTSSADASSLSADHAVAVEPMLADSLEILRGPSTLLYGGGAIGGVVNVIDGRIPTALPETTAAGLEYRHDTASDMDVAVFRADGSSGDFAFHIDGLYRDFNDTEIPGMASREHDDDHGDEDHVGEEHADEEHADEEGRSGVIENSAGRARSLTLGSSYHFDRGFAGLSVSRLESDYGIPAGAHEHTEEHGEEHEHEEEHDEEEHGEEEGNIRLELRQTRYDAALHLHDPAPFIDTSRFFLTYTDYEHKELEGSGEVGTVYSNESWEARVEMVHAEIGNFHGVFGLQARSSKFSALGEEAFVPVTDSRDLGVFLVEDYHRGDWTVEAGLRLDLDERDPDAMNAGSRDFASFSASLATLWDIAPSWQAGLSLSRAERAPAIEELYSNVDTSGPGDWVLHAATDAIELGNARLDTEVSRNVDLSLRWGEGLDYVHLAVFHNRFSDYINLVNTGVEVGDSPVRAYEQDDATFNGIEFDSRLALATLGSGELTAGVFADIVRGELDNGDDVPRLPPLRVGLHLDWVAPQWRVWTKVMDAASQDRPGENEEETPGYTRWDLGADYYPAIAEGGVELFFRVNNVTDEEIRLSTSYLRDVAPEAGRGFQAGFRLRI